MLTSTIPYCCNNNTHTVTSLFSYTFVVVGLKFCMQENVQYKLRKISPIVCLSKSCYILLQIILHNVHILNNVM